MTNRKDEMCIFGVKSKPRRQKMKKKSVGLSVIGILLMMVVMGAFPQSGEDLFQKALRLERSEGKLMEAIEIYNRVVALKGNEGLSAQAQLRIGMCYEKLGQKSVKLAQDAFQKVIDNYPQQSEEVRIAKEKLTLILKAQSKASTGEGELRISQVWADPATDLEGEPSPDGKYLSYVDSGDLAVYEIETGQKRRLTKKGSESNEYALTSRWSPNGKQIVYTWCDGIGSCDLCIIGIEASKPRILLSDKDVRWIYTFDWSQDGNQILAYFERRDGMSSQIVLVSTADGAVRVLKTFKESWPENMCFSPDGSYIVYDFPQKVGSPERDIFMLSNDGTREIPLVKHPSHDELLGWAPDGKNILFASDRNGTFSLWSIQSAEGKPQGKPELIRSSMGAIEPMGFTRGGLFYYGSSPKTNDIYTADIDPGTGKILSPPKKTATRFEGYNQTPSYSPDGKYLAYISRRFPLTIFPDYTIAKLGGNVLCIKSLETGKEREFFPNLNKFSFPRWSPDGRSVIVMEWNKSGSNQIDIQTGKVTTVSFDDNIGPQPTERSPDGKTIFYVSRDRKAKIWKVLVRNLQSDSEKEIYRSDGTLNIRLSPNGQQLAIQDNYLQSFQGASKKIPSLNIIPPTGGEPKVLCRFDEGIDIFVGAPFTWTPDGKYILYAMKTPKKDNSKWDLYRIPAEGGKPEKLGLEMGGFLMNLSIHPDGRHIAFSTSVESNAEVWVMDNFLPKTKDKK